MECALRFLCRALFSLTKSVTLTPAAAAIVFGVSFSRSVVYLPAVGKRGVRHRKGDSREF